MRGRFTLYFLGTTSAGMALVMLGFALYAYLLHEPTTGFLVTALLAGLQGAAFLLTGDRHTEPGRREAIVGVLLLWLLFPFLGGLPFALSGGFSVLDAFFEGMSGFTTTGATVLRDFDSFPLSLFMWRSLTQWLGGVGIIVFFIAVLPQLAIAGRQLFFAEVPGPTEEKLTPRLRNTASAIMLVYLLITAAAILSYWAAGMPLYDAVANGLTTPASGGFSPNGLSFMGYDSALLDWLCILFMTLAGANFALQYRALVGRPNELLRDTEFRAYLVIILVAAAFLTYTLRDSYSLFEALRHGVFQTLTMITTTGYASADFALWPEDAQAILVFLMFVGGSAGSAAGGIKVARWLIISQNSARELKRALHPRIVAPVRIGERIVSEEVVRAVSAFVMLFVLLTALTTVALALLGADLNTAFTAAIACVGNIGPGLAAVGPMLNFADLHPVSKAILIFGMYAGRLEVITVFIIFNAEFWQRPRLNWLSRRRSSVPRR